MTVQSYIKSKQGKCVSTTLVAQHWVFYKHYSCGLWNRCREWYIWGGAGSLWSRVRCWFISGLCPRLQTNLVASVHPCPGYHLKSCFSGYLACSFPVDNVGIMFPLILSSLYTLRRTVTPRWLKFCRILFPCCLLRFSLHLGCYGYPISSCCNDTMCPDGIVFL